MASDPFELGHNEIRVSVDCEQVDEQAAVDPYLSTDYPAGSYKPCFRVRVGLERQPAGVPDLAVLDDRGRVATRVSLPAPARPDNVILHQVPLYEHSNQSFPAGAYRLTARFLSAGTETASASFGVRID